MQARCVDPEQRYQLEGAMISVEIACTADPKRHLWKAETKSEAEIISRSTYEQRFLDLKNRISNQEVGHQ